MDTPKVHTVEFWADEAPTLLRSALDRLFQFVDDRPARLYTVQQSCGEGWGGRERFRVVVVQGPDTGYRPSRRF